MEKNCVVTLSVNHVINLNDWLRPQLNHVISSHDWLRPQLNHDISSHDWLRPQLNHDISSHDWLRPQLNHAISSHDWLRPQHMLRNTRQYQPAVFPVSCQFGFIWLDTTNVMWRTLHQRIHQLVCLCLLNTKQYSVYNAVTVTHNTQIDSAQLHSPHVYLGQPAAQQRFLQRITAV